LTNKSLEGFTDLLVKIKVVEIERGDILLTPVFHDKVATGGK